MDALPLISKRRLVHIGSLRVEDKGLRFGGSYEGHGLSVSEDPYAWRAIAKLGGLPWWLLRKRAGVFIDARALTEAQRSALVAWAYERGYAQPATAYTVSHYDDELEQTFNSHYTDKAEADAEAESLETEVEISNSFAATAALAARIGMTTIPGDLDHLLVAYCEEQTDCDGIWWNDRQSAIWAARGMIVPAKLASWQRRQIFPRDAG